MFKYVRRTFHSRKGANNGNDDVRDMGTSYWRTKKKVAVMKIEKLMKIFEMKISGMQKMIEIKKEAIANMQQIKEMLK